MKQVVCRKDELNPGCMTRAQLGPIKVAVIRTRNGSLHAVAAKCLHQGGPLDLGRLYDHHATGEVGEYTVDFDRTVLKCPWHGYEYDVSTGSTVFDEKRCVPTFVAREDGDDIVVELGSPPGR